MKSARWILVASLGISLIALAVMVFLVLANKGQQAFGSDWKQEDGLIILIVVPISLVIVFFSLRPFWHFFFPRKMKNPIEADAKVLKVWDTGVSVNDNPQVGVLLQVHPPFGAPQGTDFELEAKTLVSRLNAALVQPGVMAKIRYEAEKPKLNEVITFDLDSPQPHPAEERRLTSAERLQEIADLKARGLITEAEYARKREEILREI